MASLVSLADLALGPAVIIPTREPEPEDAARPDLTAWAIGIAFPLALIWCAATLIACFAHLGWL